MALGESVDTLITNLAEIHPSWMNAVPRFYEKVWMSVEQLAPPERAKKLRQIFGPRLRHLCSGGAPLPRHVGVGCAESGIPVHEGYGLTESSPVISFNSASHHRRETIAFGRRTNAILERLFLASAWRNFVKGRSERKPDRTTPAMVLGVTSEPWSWDRLLARRLFPGRVRVPASWLEVYRRTWITPRIPNTLHRLRRAY